MVTVNLTNVLYFPKLKFLQVRIPESMGDTFSAFYSLFATQVLHFIVSFLPDRFRILLKRQMQHIPFLHYDLTVYPKFIASVLSITSKTLLIADMLMISAQNNKYMNTELLTMNVVQLCYKQSEHRIIIIMVYAQI